MGVADLTLLWCTGLGEQLSMICCVGEQLGILLGAAVQLRTKLLAKRDGVMLADMNVVLVAERDATRVGDWDNVTCADAVPDRVACLVTTAVTV